MREVTYEIRVKKAEGMVVLPMKPSKYEDAISLKKAAMKRWFGATITIVPILTEIPEFPETEAQQKATFMRVAKIKALLGQGKSLMPFA